MAKKKTKSKNNKKTETKKITAKELTKTKAIKKVQKNEVNKEEKTEKKLNKYQKAYKNNSKNTQKSKQIVNAKDVIYNVPLNNELKKEIEEPKEEPTKQEPKIKYIGLKEYIALKIKEFKNNKKKTKKTKKNSKKTIDPKIKKAEEKAKRRQEYKERLILNQQLEKKVQKIEKDYSKYNIVVRTFVKLYRNLHILFNSIIIISFIILLLGAFKVEVYETSSILYFGSLLLFLIIVAISQNKYLSGKVFTIILTVGMAIVTAQIQNTYDFIKIMNTKSYEYKTYYVAAFDVPKNRTVHSLNNKKICVLKDISEKTSLVLDTKIDKATYLAYNNTDLMFEEFYSQKCRGIIVNENQYKYLENNPKKNRKIRTIYEFKAVTKK